MENLPCASRAAGFAEDMEPDVSAHPRELWQPDRTEQVKAAHALLCHDLSREARATIRQRLADWLDHAKGCRRRAHEYKRWALEYEQAGNLVRYHHYRQQYDKSWHMAKDALVHARRDFNTIHGAR